VSGFLSSRVARYLSALAYVLFGAMVTGCWDATEVNRLAIVSMSGWDLIAPHPHFKILGTVSIAKPSQLGGPNQASPAGSTQGYLVEEGPGSTIADAFANIQRQTSRRLYIAHRDVAIVGEPYAKSGVFDLMDEMARNPESRLRTFVLVAHHSRAADIVRLPYALNRLPSDAVVEMEQSGRMSPITAKEFIQRASGLGDPYMMGIGTLPTIGEKETKTIEVRDVALFHKYRLVGWLTGREADGFLLAEGTLTANSDTFSVPGLPGKLTALLAQLHVDRHVRWVRDRPRVSLDVHMEDDIMEDDAGINLHLPQQEKRVQVALEQSLRRTILNVFHALQVTYRVDCLDLADQLYRNAPAKWLRIEPSWPTLYAQLPISVEVHVILRRSGQIGPSIQALTKPRELVSERG